MTADTRPHVLVVDDEIQIRRSLRLTLESAGFRVGEAETGQLGLSATAASPPDGIVLDLGLPDIGGNMVLRRLREWSRVPVLVLTVRDAEDDKIAALDAGADDYLTKPFSSRELIARLRPCCAAPSRPRNRRCRLRRYRGGPLRPPSAARRGRNQADRQGIRLLRLLVQHRGRVVTHREILRQIWGPQAEDSTHYLRVQMTHLRKKLEAEPQQPRHLRTESGIGYRLVEA